MEEFSNWES